jgi:nucleolar MIF4G domain-containing protein 1
MPARTQSTTIRLPQSLLKKISDSTGTSGSHTGSERGRSYLSAGDVNHGHNPSISRISRKDARRLERTQIKRRKADFFSATSSAPKRRAPEEHAESPKRKKAKTANVSPVRKSHASSTPPQIPIQKPARKSHTEGRSSRKFKKSVTFPGKSQRDEDEDAYIAYLESKLGYKPGHKSSVGDGLDGAQVCLDISVRSFICVVQIYSISPTP